MKNMLRLYVGSEEDQKFYQNSKILNYLNSDRSEQFIIAMSVGYNAGLKAPLESRIHLVNEPSITEDSRNLMRILAILDCDDIKIISDEREIFKIAEEYANAGIKIIKDIESNSQDLEMDTFKKFIDDKYNELNIK